MAATDARPIPFKNAAYRVTFPIFDADGDLVTGATGLDSEVSIDGATFADCTNEATEIATSSGMYYLDLTSGEMNGDTIAVIVKTSSSGAKTTPIVLYPEEAGDIRANVTQISGDTTAADNAESFFDGTGYAGTGNVIPTVTTLTGFNTTGSGLSAIPWNASWDAEVQSECADAITAYDPPTKAELDAAVDALPTAAENADAVWDETLASHLTAGSTGAGLNAAGAAGDPWSTALPGAYGAGTAGFIVGTNLDAAVSTRASQASVDTVDGIVDAILVDTAEIGAAGAGLAALPWNAAWDAEVQSEAADALNAYDPPTNAEMQARTLAAADYATAAALTTVSTVVDSILDDTGTAGVVIADKTGYSLAAAGLDLVVIETGLNARQALSIIAASAAGTLAGAATTTVTIDGAGVATDRITATVDSNGNRTAVTLSPPA